MALPACHLRLLHVNDVYKLDNFPALKTALDALSVDLPPQNVICTLAGDFLAPSLLSSLDQGKGMVDVLNRVPVHAVCFGNHENDVPFTALQQRAKEYKGKWLNSNMRDFKPELPDNALFELEGGRSVAMLGLVIGGGKNASLYSMGAFGGHAAEIVPVLEAVDDAVARCKKAYPDADCIIPLTHQDAAQDVELAKLGHFPVILAGHDHTVFQETHEGCQVLKAGQDAFNVFVVDLRWPAGAAKGAPPEVEARLVPLAQPQGAEADVVELQFGPDAGLATIVDRCMEPVRELQKATLAKFPPGELSSQRVRFGPSTMATELAEAMKVVSGAEGALVNSGGVRGDKLYDTGLVTYSDIMAELPFESSNVVVQMPGRLLRDAVAESRKGWADGTEECPMAFQVDKGMTTDGNAQICTVDGQPLELDRDYRIFVGCYMLGANPVLKAYAEQHPERIPDPDAGRAMLPIVVEYLCDLAWNELVAGDGGDVNEEKVGALFDAMNADGDDFVTQDEVRAAVEKRIPYMASGVVVKQMLQLADANADGKISRPELKKIFLAEAVHHGKAGKSAASKYAAANAAAKRK